VRSVLVAGGVAANKLVRKQLEATTLEKGGCSPPREANTVVSCRECDL